MVKGHRQLKGTDIRFEIDGANTRLYKVYPNYRKIMGKEHYRPQFQEELIAFKKLIVTKFTNEETTTYIHFGDGDFFFLSKKSVGSATPGKRALSVSYEQIDMRQYKEGFLKNDYICVECFVETNHTKFAQLYPSIKVDYPTEYLYGLLSCKWFFKTFPNKIGLIGAKEKLDLIKLLLERKEYQDYLGIDTFTDYITIPQKFACDDLDKVCTSVEKQLKTSTSSNQFKIFLCGIGHVKSGLFYKFKEWQKGIFLDVGGGIDALAGIIDHQRPYMASWVNYQLKNYDYSKLDFLQYNMRDDKYKEIIE